MARCSLRWESLVGTAGCRTTTGRSAGPKNVGVEWCHFQFPYYIYTRVRCYLIHTHTNRPTLRPGGIDLSGDSLSPYSDCRLSATMGQVMRQKNPRDR